MRHHRRRRHVADALSSAGTSRSPRCCRWSKRRARPGALGESRCDAGRVRPERGGRRRTLGDVTAATPEGRRLLRLEARNAAVPDREQAGVDQDPRPDGPGVHRAQGAGPREGLHTVCEEAGCPNIYECWEDREATFLIGGDQCTRRCDFCQIDTGRPAPLDRDEPRRVAEPACRRWACATRPITGVARDDLDDERRLALRRDGPRRSTPLNPGTGVELLVAGLHRQCPSCSPRCSAPRPRCSRTTSRRCRGSSSGSGRRSATSARSTSSARRARPGWSPSPT